MVTILDHLAVGTPTLSDGWELFGGILGGTWAYGGDSPGFWLGQLEFAAGPKIELLTPTGDPDTDIEGALAQIKAVGIEPVGANTAVP